MPVPYNIGDEISAAEFCAVRDALLPRHSKVRQFPATTIINRLLARAPLRLDYEVNRVRGFAFESGADGFSHQRIPEGS